MMHSRSVQIWVGLFVVAGMAALLMLSMKVSNISAFTESEGFEVTGYFENIGGLKVRSPVTMAGVVVGRVANIGFDKDSYEAVVTLNIQNEYDNIPVDSSASIFTAGLLGEQYIGLEAGGAEEVLKAGSELELTQSAIVLEQIIGQFLVSQADKE
ncbi:MAG: outer membrane lipid asymmetry maintenance protein MlaD [Gammaproteobacteria bacterium]|nr:outer membrane lipid asymmetry maintenance protein MlaD [Gammaproteobacteria bacterium]MCF6258845.1 outer membrane lipid asymmetry maintenance protein MlaD [Gammaproteobacteria bacterium]